MGLNFHNGLTMELELMRGEDRVAACPGHINWRSHEGGGLIWSRIGGGGVIWSRIGEAAGAMSGGATGAIGCISWRRCGSA